MNNQAIWYLAYTKPGREQEAKENIDRQGYTTYLPMLQGRKRQRGRLRDILTPLFPRYLFIQLTEGIDDWSPIRSTRGVNNLVRFGPTLARVPDALIAKIRAREADDGFHCEKASFFKRGDKIRIVDGPFTDCDAIFQTRCGEERVMILLDVVGKATRVEIPRISICTAN